MRGYSRSYLLRSRKANAFARLKRVTTFSVRKKKKRKQKILGPESFVRSAGRRTRNGENARNFRRVLKYLAHLPSQQLPRVLSRSCLSIISQSREDLTEALTLAFLSAGRAQLSGAHPRQDSPGFAASLTRITYT